MRNLFDPAAYDIPETGVTFSCDNAALQAVFDDCEQLLKQNVQDFGGRKVLIEGAAYRNVWLETQPMGGEMYAKRDAAVAMQNVLVFFAVSAARRALSRYADVERADRIGGAL